MKNLVKIIVVNILLYSCIAFTLWTFNILKPIGEADGITRFFLFFITLVFNVAVIWLKKLDFGED